MVFNDVIFTVEIWRYYTVIGGPNNRLTGNGKNHVGNTRLHGFFCTLYTIIYVRFLYPICRLHEIQNFPKKAKIKPKLAKKAKKFKKSQKKAKKAKITKKKKNCL
jgi:hypothetical protein